MTAGTQEVNAVDTAIDGKRLVLLDTPGLDDTSENSSDFDIFLILATQLRRLYEENMLFNGVIILQPLEFNRRIRGTERRMISLLKRIVGFKCLDNVVIGCTMIDDMKEEGVEQRKKDRKDEVECWGQFCDHEPPAEVVSHYNTKESAIRIVRKLMNKDPKPLLIQKELEQSGDGDLMQTSAGKYLDDYFKSQINKIKRKLQQDQSKWNEPNLPPNDTPTFHQPGPVTPNHPPPTTLNFSSTQTRPNQQTLPAGPSRPFLASLPSHQPVWQVPGSQPISHAQYDQMTPNYTSTQSGWAKSTTSSSGVIATPFSASPYHWTTSQVHSFKSTNTSWIISSTHLAWSICADSAIKIARCVSFSRDLSSTTEPERFGPSSLY